VSSESSTFWKRQALLVAAIGLLLAPAVASAESSDTFPGTVPATFRLRLGGTYQWFNTKVTFQENLTPGGPISGGISMEDILGVPGSGPGFDGRGSWNFVGRFYLDFGYSYYSRSHTETIGQSFNFGDSTYTVGATVGASMKSQLPYVDFRYGIIKNESLQFGISVGAAYPILNAEASASGGVIGPGGPIVGESVSKSAKLEVPVPLLGLAFDMKLGDALSFGGLINGIFAPVHPYTGSIIFADAHIDWFASKNLGVGAAFDYTKFSIKRDDGKTLVDFSYDYYGPRVYLIVTF